MKVLMVNKFNFVKGGSDRYFLELSDLLAKEGVKVAKFCMEHPDNLPSPYKKYFVSQIDFNSNNWLKQLKAIGRTLYSREAARKFEELIKNFLPDIVHVHNIYHQISPSILTVAKKYRLPIVMHLHDYKLVCANYKMFSHGKIDESEKGGHYWRCVANKCFRNSYLASLLVALEMYIHHSLLKIYEKNIDLYISPSQFMKDKLVEWGIPAEKIQVVKHYIDTQKYKPDFELGDYILYFGRLAEEKGVDLLLKAYGHLHTSKKLLIVGSGSEHKKLHDLAGKLGLALKVKFTGPKHGEELKRIIKGSYMVVVPSRWYEVFGLVNLEAAALGKMVLAANIGGITEVVNNHHTGLLYKYDSVNDLTTKLEWCLDNPKQVAEFARDSRHFVENNFQPKNHVKNILNIYQDLISLR